ncbi:MAG: hypothetical protein H8E83_07755 [Planctomycetes bacterium]|nr:hypothetical protein [Planctomycetota bacterium]
MNTSANNSLWASAFLLMACILFAASKHTPTANADSTASGNGFTMVTTPDGRGTDLLYVIDDQNQVLMIYFLPDPKQVTKIEPVAAWSLPNLFSTVRN